MNKKKILYSIIISLLLLCNSSVFASTTLRPNAFTEYVIRPGDTLEEISVRANVPMSSLISKNDIENPNMIYAGDILLIPRPVPSFIIPPSDLPWWGADTPDTFEYVIVSGDTLSEIAEANNTTVEILAELNNISNINQIMTGEILLIPIAEAQEPEQPEVPETPETQEPQPEEPNTPDEENPEKPDTPETPNNEEFGIYNVVSGDTYIFIAGKIDGEGGITSDILEEYNGDKMLFPGDEIIYPLSLANKTEI